MGTNVNYFDWDDFWKNFPEEPDEIQDVEGLIYRNKTGQWVTCFVIPNSKDVIACSINYDPWTGEKLR